VFIFVLMGVIDPIYGVVFAALVAPVGAYFLAAHKMSGKINTSEAQQLWEESRAIRDWSSQEIQSLRAALSEAMSRISHLEEQNRELTEQNASLSKSLSEAHNHIATLEEHERSES
jgi:septal ring factor EnvC (AmiA/AmiB activator)